MASQEDHGAVPEGALTSAIQPMFAALVTQTTISGCELGVFERLSDHSATARQLAQSIGVKEHGLRMLLDGLTATGQLQKDNSHYRLPEPVRAVLSLPGVDPQTYFRDLHRHATDITNGWSKLTEVIRTGKSVIDVSDGGVGPEFFASLVRMLFPGNYVIAQALFEATKDRFGHGALEVLDVAAGAAPWSMAFASGNRSAHVTAVDFPVVLEVARQFAAAFGVEDRYTLLPGDIRRVPFDSGRFDLALLGHICHSEGASHTQRLFRKVAQALKPEGAMLVADFVADEDRSGSNGGAFAVLFALNMLVHTEEGGTFTLHDYETWAKEAGFRRHEVIEVPGPSPVLLFEK